MNSSKPKSIDDYISIFPNEVQLKLLEIRTLIKQIAPEAEELISYQMPAFKLNGILVYFAAYKRHIGFYPTASGISAFQNELAKYKYSKGAVQFPLSEDLPLDLIEKIVKFRINENLDKKK